MAFSKFLDPKNDFAFRRIFGSERNKDILIHFINDILELKNNDQVEEVSFLSPIQDPEIASKKQSIVDVLCKDKLNRQIIVEMQVSPQEGFEKRAQYYAAKAYSRQLNQGNTEGCRYMDLKEVVFIAISDYIVFKDKPNYKSNHVILDRESYARDLKDFSFTFIELPKFTIEDIGQLKNMTEKWCYFFKHAAHTHEDIIAQLVGSDIVIKRAYDELNQYHWTEDELLTYEWEWKRMMDNKAVEDYQRNRGREEGKAEGRAEGKAEGRAEGKAEGRAEGKAEGRTEGRTEGRAEALREVAKMMLRQGSSIDAIMALTTLSKEEIQNL